VKLAPERVVTRLSVRPIVTTGSPKSTSFFMLSRTLDDLRVSASGASFPSINAFESGGL
jgi:hypothetical protein